MMPISLLVLAVTVVLDVAGQLCFKIGLNEQDAAAGAPAWRRVATSPLVATGVLVYAVELVLWLYVLAHLPLSLAFPVACLSYGGVALAGRFILHEPMSTESWIGTAVITLGAVLVSLSA